MGSLITLIQVVLLLIVATGPVLETAQHTRSKLGLLPLDNHTANDPTQQRPATSLTEPLASTLALLAELVRLQRHTVAIEIDQRQSPDLAHLNRPGF